MIPENVEHGKAVAALVLGIISCVSCLTGIGAIVGVVLAIIGLVLSRKATVAGNMEGINKAGFVLSIIGVCISGVTVIISIGALGILGATGAMM